jgi:STE24 endopeptidase
MYLVVIAILSIVLAFSEPLFRCVVAPGQVVAAVAAATLGPPVVALLVSRRALRLLERRPDEPGQGQAALGRGSALVQAVLAGAHGAVLLCTDWLLWVERVPRVGTWPVVPAVLAIVPFLISVVLVWIVSHPADRAVRQIALEMYLFRGRPVRPVWSLREYLVYNLRHQLLFVLIPMLLIVAARDIISIYDDALRRFAGHAYFSDVLLGLAALLVAVVAPEILRYVWATQRLPNGPLRDRLQALCRKLGVRCREILVWKAGGMIVNAAVMGIVAPLRYVLITDGMLEQMDDTRIEAVFGHEAAHVKRHHIFFFMLFALISGCIVTVFSIRCRHLSPQSLRFQVLAAGLGALLLFKWSVVFGWISRRFERQADIFGVRTLALSGLPCVLPCALHGDSTEGRIPAARPDALCSTAAHLFANTLNEVAVLNGISPEARSWRHGSISSRSRLVQKLALDPGATTRSERTVAATKLVIFVCALIGSLWSAWEMQIWKLLGL